MNELDNLHTAIEDAYTIFARYPLRHPVIGCTCCVSREDQERLAAKVLRRLDGSDLERFVWKAMSTWGDEDDFKHFLPRVMELVSVSQEGDGLPDVFVFFGKLSYCPTWSDEEQQAVHNYLVAFWLWILAGHPGCEKQTLTASTFLESLVGGVSDLRPFLRVWQEIRTPSALRQMAELIRYHAWGHELARNTQFRAWLHEKSTKEIAEEGFYTWMEEDWADELALAVEVLEWLQATSPRREH